MGFFNKLKEAALKEAKKKIMEELGLGGDDDETKPTMTTEEFERTKPDELRKDIRMISGCQDRQTSADVSNVSSFQLPDPAGEAGGACTSTLLNILYADEQVPEDDLSFVEVLEEMRIKLKSGGYSQIPQLSSMNPIDVNSKFDLVPDTATGTKRAVMIGINYVGDDPGELSGCWNDVLNMKKYIQDVHGFEEENIVILMDDGIHTEPTKANIIDAYKTIIAQAEENDAIFLHYSGHGTKLRDDDGDESDGYDEALVPRDFQTNGMIRDDDLYELLLKNLPDGVHMTSLMDCCHSGTILDLPYLFKGDGSQTDKKRKAKDIKHVATPTTAPANNTRAKVQAAIKAAEPPAARTRARTRISKLKQPTAAYTRRSRGDAAAVVDADKRKRRNNQMTLDPNMNLDAFIEKLTGKLMEFLQAKMAASLSL